MRKLLFILFFMPLFLMAQLDVSDGNFTFNAEVSTDNSFAEMYDPSTVISTASATVYYALKGWTAGLTNNATADVLDSMMIIDQAGTYILNGSFSFTHATNSTLVHICAWKRNGDWSGGEWIELINVEAERLIGNGGDFGNLGFTGLVTLAAGDTLGVRTQSNNSGNLTVNHGNFNVTRIK